MMLEAFNQKKYFPNGESNLQPQRKNANDFPQHYRDFHAYDFAITFLYWH